ncbi:ABC transporter permease [Gloeocapsopsis dulcis]|uniref:Transport permease protein n=1 Tax=Gloeocapsopsis dulcis AAB1 = 1H9 TaxID=1433147 RepID=A0A6N8FVF5_9CHRO|nr:ABC transporter permease [Gloeocapsopsis dulcis]MUL36147.1 multidrug ABC transporter permease [Gloeocapsopsis dulcis AAB1 = 1H9]WNN91376.1 ABC transporter permease [Gloeocapsopsis dulcis]
MTLQPRDVPHNDWVKTNRVGFTVREFIEKALVAAELEIRKLRHDPIQLFTRAVQPVLWLTIFGQVFTQVRGIPTGNLSYIDFMTPGILAQSVLFMSIFTGLLVIWEKDLGILHKLMVSPAPRAALVLGKAIGAGVRCLSQLVVVYAVAALLRVNLDWNPLAVLGVAIAVMLGAALFSTLSLIVACWAKTHERVMGVGQLMMMPLFFASNAIYPISIMPPWLQVLSRLNPLTYLVDALRDLMLMEQAGSYSLLLNFVVLASVTAVLIAFCGRLYPRLVR